MALNRQNNPTFAEKMARRTLRDVREERMSMTRLGMILSLDHMEHDLEYADVYAAFHRLGPGAFLGETARRRRNDCMHDKAALAMRLRTYRRSQAHLRDTAADLFDNPNWESDDIEEATRARRVIETNKLAAEDWTY